MRDYDMVLLHSDTYDYAKNIISPPMPPFRRAGIEFKRNSRTGVSVSTSPPLIFDAAAAAPSAVFALPILPLIFARYAASVIV